MEVNTAPAAGKSYLVSVLQNGSSIYSCTIAATTTSCTSTAPGVSVHSGDRLQVQIPNNAGAPNKAFKVVFRYQANYTLLWRLRYKVYSPAPRLDDR